MIHEHSTEAGFAALGITGALLKAVNAAGFDQPKPIQVEAIPPQLEGRDILGVAQTGSGKTAAFSLPILTKIVGLGTRRLPKTARALILAPTRELAVQIEETVRLLSKGLHVSTALVLGGVSKFSQTKRIAPGVDVLVATPGRLMELLRDGAVNLAETRWLVLDEADRMLDMGFINDVKRIARATHRERQTALFSATMPTEIEALAQSLLRDPVQVEVSPRGSTASEIRQSVVHARLKQKRAVLSAMLRDEAMRSVLVFARTKHGADRVARDLERDGLPAGIIHGNKSQNARQKALNGFKDGSLRILVATDIAARGIDVPGISHVVNFDLPDEAETYVHRVGRTGRNGADGIAITLCDPNEAAKLRAVEKVIRMKLAVAADHTGEPDPQPAARSAAGAAEQRPAARPAAAKPHRHGGHARGHGAEAGQARHGAEAFRGNGDHGDRFRGKPKHAGRPGEARQGKPAHQGHQSVPQGEFRGLPGGSSKPASGKPAGEGRAMRPRRNRGSRRAA